MPRKIIVVYYDPAWPDAFVREAELLEGLLGDLIVSLHHVGSTAIPGMAAKPIIDILIETGEISKIDEFNGAFAQVGYLPHGENGVSKRRFFTKDTGGNRSHHLHIHQSGDPHIQDHLNFRDYLTAHPQAAERYAALKRMLAQKYPDEIGSYINGKLDFIHKTFQDARRWRVGSQQDKSRSQSSGVHFSATDL